MSVSIGSMENKVVIIGSGIVGMTIAYQLLTRKLSKKILCTTEINDLSNCEILFLVSPVQYLSSVLSKLNNHIKHNTIFICCSKGLEMSSLRLPSQIVSSVFPKNAGINCLKNLSLKLSSNSICIITGSAIAHNK